MSGLSLASHPLLGGRRAAHGANQGCLRAFVCLLLRARPCGGFALLCFLPVAHSATGPLLRSHLVRPHVTVWALLVFARVVAAWACCGRVCSVGGWVGCLRYCPCSLGVFALSWCWRACLGWWGSVAASAPLPRLACLRVHALVWALLACAVVLRLPPCVRGVTVWGGTTLSRPIRRGVRCPADACAGREAWRVGCSQGANTGAHTQRGRERGVCAFWCVQSPSW